MVVIKDLNFIIENYVMSWITLNSNPDTNIWRLSSGENLREGGSQKLGVDKWLMYTATLYAWILSVR